MSFAIRWFLWLATRPKEIRPYLISSINASYTRGELEALLQRTQLRGWHVKANPFGVIVSGRKPNHG
jgi:hypothetical protein